MVVIRLKARLVRLTGKRSIQERDLMRKRQAITYSSQVLTSIVEGKARTAVVEFLRKTLWRKNVKKILTTFVPKIKKFQKMIRTVQLHNKARFTHFQRYWDKEQAIYCEEIEGKDKRLYDAF